MNEPAGRLVLPAELDRLREMVSFAAGCARDAGLPPDKAQAVELAAEEALVNIISYAYPGGSGDVELVCGQGPAGRFLLEIRDRGPSFDPTRLADPDLSGPAEDRPVGGLGVFFIRQFVDEVSWRREGGQNVLTLALAP